MILVISSFRVANGLEADVRRAFLERPHLVDTKPGFLGMEVFTDAADPALFTLATRWTDRASYQAWHRSHAHHESHEGIPKGLKLVPASTTIRELERIEPAGAPPSPGLLAADHPEFVGSFLEEAEGVHVFLCRPDGTILHASRPVAGSLRLPESALPGRSLFSLVIAADAAALADRIASAERRPRETFLVNFCGADHAPYSLKCRLDAHPGHFLLLGAPAIGAERRTQEELLKLNNELAVAIRENERQRRAVEQATEERDRSRWHLKKIQEVLPICMRCNKVKSSAAKWEQVADYLKANALFLSHGYCPECAEKVRAEWNL